MLSLLQHYPLKLNHLSDDLESFVHVLEIMCLRFHLHRLSATIIASGKATVYDQQRNARNECFHGDPTLL